MQQDLLIRGDVLRYSGDPFAAHWAECVHVDSDVVIEVRDGQISAIHPADATLPPDVPLENFQGHLICPGFVDAHVHYPQTGIIASWGKRLIDWLQSYTFPEEMRFGDKAYASQIAETHLDLVLSHGTTATASFCTIHPESVDAYFEAAAKRNMAVVAGKTCMDRDTAPEGLRDTAQNAYDQSAAVLNRWHNAGRARYAITPRFSPTSTPEQLEALGALWAENPTCLMQTHLSEQVDEVEWVGSLFPSARDYLDTYEMYGLLGTRGLYGHAIYLTDRERDLLAEVGAGLVHCPTSNTFIGSGLFDMSLARHMPVGLATDTGGGSSFSMLRTMATAYEIAQLRGAALHPAELLWLATQGSARVLHRQDEIGQIAPGFAADLVAIRLDGTPDIAQRARRANDIWEAIFPTIMMGDDRSIARVWVAGREIAGAR